MGKRARRAREGMIRARGFPRERGVIFIFFFFSLDAVAIFRFIFACAIGA